MKKKKIQVQDRIFDVSVWLCKLRSLKFHFSFPFGDGLQGHSLVSLAGLWEAMIILCVPSCSIHTNLGGVWRSFADVVKVPDWLIWSYPEGDYCGWAWPQDVCVGLAAHMDSLSCSASPFLSQLGMGCSAHLLVQPACDLFFGAYPADFGLCLASLHRCFGHFLPIDL